jgi:serine kinase of HPr protein (carbohydrate metabolism regulator)
LAFDLLNAAAHGLVRFSRLVTDDRAEIEARHGRLLVRAPVGIQGLIEIRGLGLHRVPFEPVAAVGLVVDLADPDAERLPSPGARKVEIQGILLPRLALATGGQALAVVLAALAIPGRMWGMQDDPLVASQL